MAIKPVPVAGKKRQRGRKAVVLAALFVLIAAGGLGASAVSSRADLSQGAKVMAPAVRDVLFTTSPEAQAQEVNPAQPVNVTVANGRLSGVNLIDTSNGEAVPGDLAPGEASWASRGQLKFNTQYRLDYLAQDQARQEHRRSQTFSTVSSRNEANAWTATADGATVGVGQPVQISFSEPVVNKAAVEAAIKITSSAGQTGAFRWYSDTMLRYRPESFWIANSTVTVDMQLFGVDFGNGQIGNFTQKTTMNIGDKQVLVADAEAKVAQYYVNDKLVRTMPATMGSEDFPSASGYLVVMSKQETARFDATTIGLKPGDPGWYDPLVVNSATRLSNSGIFIHEATPAAMPYLGQRNLSHGCVGLNPADARFLFDTMLTGSLVEGTNTGNDTIAATDGFGDWNIPWSQWAQR